MLKARPIPFFLLIFIPFYCQCETLYEGVSSIEIYVDQELSELWDSLEDVCNPTPKDYEKIHHYLRYGERPYLAEVIKWGKRHKLPVDPPKQFPYTRRLLQCLQVYDGNEPLFQTVKLKSTRETSCQCVILYASCNHGFLLNDNLGAKARQVISELEANDFPGYVILRIGGYPMLHQGGLQLIHVPYSFKVLSFIEAEWLGFDQALWIDVSVHPTNNLHKVFSKIKKDGYFAVKSGTNLDYDDQLGLLPECTLFSWGIAPHLLKQIPHIIAGIFGISFKHSRGRAIIKEWYKLTAQTLPAMSFYPEEFLLSLVCWQLNLPPSEHVGYLLDVKSLVPYKHAKKTFWHDKS